MSKKSNGKSRWWGLLGLLILPACCIGIPLLLGVLATGGASILAGLSAVSPYLIGLGAVLVAGGGWLSLRRWRA